MSGGLRFEVAEEVKDDFYCIICTNLMRDAVQLKCGHGMCKSCLDSWEDSRKESHLQAVCPTCRRVIYHNSVTPATMINRIILSVKVKCEHVNKGCGWIGEISNMEDHLQKRCGFQLVCCTFQHCEGKVERHKLTNHQKECPYKPEACQYCKLVMLRSQIQGHYHTCGKFPVKCPNNCSDELMKRETVENHRAICQEEIISCEFSALGCNYLCSRKSLSAHSQDFLQQHLSLTLRKITAMEVIEKKFKDTQVQETNWYAVKILSMMKDMLTDKNRGLALFYKKYLEEFDSAFGLFYDNLPNLKSRLDKLDTGSLLEKCFSECLSLIKKDIFISDIINENVKAEVREKFIELMVDEKQKYEIALSTEERFKGLLNTMEDNTKYDQGTNYFYKINLTSNWSGILIDDNFVYCHFVEGQHISLEIKQDISRIKAVSYNKNLNEYHAHFIHKFNRLKRSVQSDVNFALPQHFFINNETLLRISFEP